MFALTQISGLSSGIIYAERGEEVTIIRTNYDGHLLCSGVNGMFACWPDKLGEVKPEEQVPYEEPKQQLTLF